MGMDIFLSNSLRKNYKIKMQLFDIKITTQRISHKIYLFNQISIFQYYTFLPAQMTEKAKNLKFRDVNLNDRVSCHSLPG